MKNQHNMSSDSVAERANRPNHMYGYCRVIGCNKPARAGTSDGLDTRFCRSHAEHYQRHGSPYKGSYPAKTLNPYRQAALAWLLEHEDDFWVVDCLRRVNGLYSGSGPHVEAFRLVGLPPKERARKALSRLRVAKVDPRSVIAAWLAVEMVHRDDPQPELKPEYRRVQFAKIIHRMASGSHKRWERTVTNPHNHWQTDTVVTELHVYPRSRGRVLRHLGEMLEGAMELLVAHRLDDIHAYKRERDQRGKYDNRPYPKEWAAKKRKLGSNDERGIE